MSSVHAPVNAANRDCPKCRSRRIPCDRTIPKCRKCISRGFDCPAYGVYLRWGQGVASRGKLMGQKVPVRRAAQTLEKRLHRSGDINLQDLMRPVLPRLGPELSFDAVDANLLCHFHRGVAARLTWVDGPQNPWRNVILPLSQGSPTVLHSVLALASQDLASKYPPDHPWVQSLGAVSAHHRDRALSWLTREIGALLRTPNAVACTGQARFVLASALLLYNLELLTAPAAQWRVHMQCAREIIQWKVQAANSPLSANVADIFLLYEYYYTSVFIGLTAFDPTADLQGDIPTCDSITLFSDFIRIMHTVTQAERLIYTKQSDLQIVRVEHILAEIEAAKARMIQLGQTIEFKSPEAQRDFEYLVHMYYHATLIYSCRVLAASTSFAKRICSSRNSILEHVLQLSLSAAVAHDLVWPLFIAGSECRGIPHMQRIVEHAMTNIMQVSGCLDRNRVLSFLKIFWSVELDPSTTWFQYARAKSINFSSLIIL